LRAMIRNPNRMFFHTWSIEFSLLHHKPQRPVLLPVLLDAAF
jgi:hypothetical protein